jgi:NADPH2:quinone reductase
MKAVWYERIGPARDVLVYGDMPTPQAGAGEIRIRLEAAGINPADAHRRGARTEMEYPRVITGSDGAGIVDQVGPGAARFKVGDRVWLYNGQRNGRAFGTAAEYIAIDENLATPLPDNVSFAEGATLGIPAMTAWCCLFSDGDITGQTVLVTGGAGAVGHYGVQFAKAAGARVIATVSSETKAEQARSAGADLIVNYKTDDVVARVMDFTAKAGVNRIVDVDFGGNIAVTQQLIAPNGTIAVYATKGNPSPQIPMQLFNSNCITLHGAFLPALPETLRRKAQAGMLQWMRSGRRIHNVAAQFPLAQTVDAHLAVEAGNKLGTVVIDCAR